MQEVYDGPAGLQVGDGVDLPFHQQGRVAGVVGETGGVGGGRGRSQIKSSSPGLHV